VATRVRTTPLGFAPPAFGEEERANVLRSLETGWLTSGPFATQLEEEFAAYCGVEHAFAVSSCTTAMHLALVALGIGTGDEVLTTPLTWPATANVVVQTGAKPVFCDVDPVTLCIDPADVAARVTTRTRAIMPVHYGGHPCAMDTLLEVADDHGLALVEDAAHAVETRADGGRKVGAIGDATCFSFYANKNLAAGEGGMLTLRDDAFADRVRSLRLHGLDRDAWKRYKRQGPGRYDVVEPGYKYNLSDLHAGVALGQLHSLEEHHTRRAAQTARYDEGLVGLPGITPVGRRLGPGARHAYHLYVIRIDPAIAGGDRDAYADALKEAEIGSGLHFLAVHELTWYRARNPELRLPHAELAAREVLSLPLSPAHSLDDIDDVIGVLRDAHAKLSS
jgi:dTDP-4-amino-4,6-dideoxygalactose transaminase